ncbi:hypothetical protein LX36DRAFT_182113 [Colletotrichum falcatum]|nr:hypothetical protein LX36DRAFT_182113 [Colletotrichum falcatum]
MLARPTRPTRSLVLSLSLSLTVPLCNRREGHPPPRAATTITVTTATTKTRQGYTWRRCDPTPNECSKASIQRLLLLHWVNAVGAGRPSLRVRLSRRTDRVWSKPLHTYLPTYLPTTTKYMAGYAAHQLGVAGAAVYGVSFFASIHSS